MPLIIPLTEAQFQVQVTELAERLGWSWLHINRMQGETGWRTPVSGPLGKGFPDLLLVKGTQVLFVELKADTGYLSPAQKVLQSQALRDQRFYVWRPRDWVQVMDVLHA